MCVKQVVRMTPPAKHDRQETTVRPRRALFRRRRFAVTALPVSSTAVGAEEAMHLMSTVGSMPTAREMAPRSTIATTFVVVVSMSVSGLAERLDALGGNSEGVLGRPTFCSLAKVY